MDEKRRHERLAMENEITISIISRGKQQANEKFIYHISKDISASGARIRANTFLPVGTLIKILLTLKSPTQVITALGKIKWVRSLYSDETYEAGLEFIETSGEAIEQLAIYVNQILKNKKGI